MLATPFSDDNVRAPLIESHEKTDPPGILPIDAKTPDKWVSRDERMIRLTGAHPFNAEAPLSLLYNQGFITPPNLHFVRNHGLAAQVTAEEANDWSFTIEGMVRSPTTMSLADLQSDFEAITMPVTLTCAGNRRKEQNMARKSKGFNWGAGGTSCSFWTGALLCDVLEKVKPLRGARYVIFEGHESLPNGKYSTGILLNWAKDFDRGIMLAWKQNGQALAPDHGRPLRVVIPGVIGGRSVKWLKRIIISDSPPDGWYHKYDNRVLPTTVTPEMSAASEEWWCDERYAIYNLNLQSVIVFPEHNSTLSKCTEETFTLKGYAYNGGGIQVSRVEISLDSGKTWVQAKIRYPEQELREMNARGELKELYGGKVDLAERYLMFCWCFWEVDLPTIDIVASKDIVVRAMDLNMVAQPRDMYWSVLGMLGNWWYRLAILDQGDHIKFLHPTNLKASDGWMDLMKSQGKDPAKWFAELSAELTENEKQSATKPQEEVKMVKDEMLSVAISQEDLTRHENWFVVQGQVYDGTHFLAKHPGGPESITMVSGEDATEDFMAIHSENAKRMLSDYHIGYLDSSVMAPLTEPSSADDGIVSSTFLNPKKWKKTELIRRTDVSPDTRLFDFALESPQQTSGLHVGAHVFMRVRDEGNDIIMRAYTPMSCQRTTGVLTLLVKVYFPRGSIPGGKMGLFLENMKIGDTVEIKGPTGSFTYLGRGDCKHRGENLHAKNFYMVCGGSGITPCYQIMKELAFDREDPTCCRLFFANRDSKDVMCYREIEQFRKDADGRIVIEYFLSSPSSQVEDFEFTRGRISQEVLSRSVGSDLMDGEAMLMVCGPPGMVESVKAWAALNKIAENRLVIF